MTHLTNAAKLILIFATILLSSATLFAQTTTFTYQGRFTDSTLPQPTNGSYEMQYSLFDTATVGTGLQLGTTQTFPGVVVSNGVFTVQLDYGGTIFRGGEVYIEIGVRPLGSAQPFTLLTPRQQITAAPIAIRSRASNFAETATNADFLGGLPASNYAQLTDPRLTDDRNPLAGNANYIQNQTAGAQAANFNVGGNGAIGGNFAVGGTITVPVANLTNLNVSGNGLVTGNIGIGGTITGNGGNVTNLNAGNIATGTLLPARGGTGLNTAGVSGNFLRSNGSTWASSPFLASDIPAGSGSYIQNATVQQTTSNFNVSGSGTVGGAFTGNTVNSATNFKIGGTTVFSTPNGTSVVIGQFANHNLLAASSTFLGFKAGLGSNSFSQANTFIGSEAGELNTSGGNNAFVGKDAGFFNTSGSFNSFFGSGAGESNKTASDNSFFGYQAGGSNALGTHNAFFGSSSGANGINASDNSFFGYLAGVSNVSGTRNSFFGSGAGQDSVNVDDNSFFGNLAGSATTGQNNTFVGSSAGSTNTTGFSNTYVGTATGSLPGSFSNAVFGSSATAQGNKNVVAGTGGQGFGDDDTVIGSGAAAYGNDNTIIGFNSRTIGTLSHATALGADAQVDTDDTVVLGTLADTVVAPNILKAKSIVVEINVKTNSITAEAGHIKEIVIPFPPLGTKPMCMDNANRVGICQPPLPNEPIEKSSELNAAIKQQQAQIAQQAEQIKRQSAQIDALMKIVCSTNPSAAVCGK